MNKKTVLAFIKKYPMSILLAIIAINLFSIAGTLKNNGRAEVNKNLCTKYYALAYSKPAKPQNEFDAFKRSIARKIGIPKYQLGEYCSRLRTF